MPTKKLTDKQKEILIKRISGILNPKEDIYFVYIFGSFAMGNSFKDIDIGIFISEEELNSPLQLELEIEKELEDAINIPVDVRIINNAPLSFIYNILKHKIVIVDRNKTLRADFEGLVYKKYFDFQHLRKEYLREITNAPV